MENIKIKVGFYFNNSKYENIDFSNPNNGNPGVGGVEYMFSLVSYNLSNYFETYVFTNIIDHLSNKTINIKANSLEEALIQAEKSKIDYLVCRSFGKKEDYDLLKKYDCKIIIWGHNFSKLKELNWIYKCKEVVKYVCVSKQQYSLLNGHPVYKKSTYIFNGLPLKSYVKENKEVDKSICYIGSVIKGKGFDKCCRVWRRLYDNGYKLPFNVIGSAKLYNSSKQLGDYNIATPEYEKEFIEFLTDDNGKILNDVRIYGVLDHNKKIDVINDSYFGISASDEETFGLVALEFETLGKPFISTITSGYIDSVYNPGSNLVNSEEELYKKCIEIINLNKNEYIDFSKACIDFASRFDIDNIIKEWNDLIINSGKNHNDIKENKLSIINRIDNIIKLVLNKH